jgi:dolichol-phosphate mannosyltransferase
MDSKLAIIIPTLNEGGNIRPLYQQLTDVLGQRSWEIIFVDDDSGDNTREEVRKLSNEDARVKLVHRIGRRGLSSACLEGMATSNSDYLLVMDADLQHDTSIIPLMLEKLEQTKCDLVVGSRFKDGANQHGLSKIRERGSRFVNQTMKFFTKNEMTDPLSGFFMLPRSVYNETKYQVSGIGFKILLDIIMSSKRKLNVTELPFEFRERHAGASKLDISIVSEFFGLIIEKLSKGKFPMRFFMFLCVGCVGAIFHLVVMFITYRCFEIDFLYAQTAATYTAIAVNFFLNNAFTYRDSRLKGASIIRGLCFFMLVCSVGALNNLIVAEALLKWGLHWIFASLTGAIYGSVWNYFMSSILVWFKKPTEK